MSICIVTLHEETPHSSREKYKRYMVFHICTMVYSFSSRNKKQHQQQQQQQQRAHIYGNLVTKEYTVTPS